MLATWVKTLYISWVSKSSQGKSKTMVIYLFTRISFFLFFLGGGGWGGDKLHYGLRENGDLEYRHVDDGSDTIACGLGATFLL